MAFVGGRHLKKGGAYFKVALVSSLVKISLFHRCFSKILVVKTKYVVYP